MKKPPEPAGESVPNLAPMVDVIMVLLVFFLLGTSLELARHGILQTELDPSSGPGEGAAVSVNPVVRIALGDVQEGAGASIVLMDEYLPNNDFEQLREMLAQRRRAGADPDNPVVITPEVGVRWRYVVRAMDASVRAGFKNVQFAVSLRAGAVGE